MVSGKLSGLQSCSVSVAMSPTGVVNAVPPAVVGMFSPLGIETGTVGLPISALTWRERD